MNNALQFAGWILTGCAKFAQKLFAREFSNTDERRKSKNISNVVSRCQENHTTKKIQVIHIQHNEIHQLPFLSRISRFF